MSNNAHTLQIALRTVEGFKPKLLAVRPVAGKSILKPFRIQLFWIFTFLGLTVPYRIWFSRNCDNLCVSIIKETCVGVDMKEPSTHSWHSFLSQGKNHFYKKSDRGETFRQMMQQVLLYEKDTDKSERMMETLIELQNEISESEEPMVGCSDDANANTAAETPNNEDPHVCNNSTDVGQVNITTVEGISNKA